MAYTIDRMSFRHRCAEIVDAEPRARELDEVANPAIDTFQIVGNLHIEVQRYPWKPEPLKVSWNAEAFDALDDDQERPIQVEDINFCPYCAVELKKTLTVDFKLE